MKSLITSCPLTQYGENKWQKKIGTMLPAKGARKSYLERQNNQRYCSTECQQANYKPRLKKKKCKVCNDRFETRNDSVTCSKFCAIVYNTANRQKYTDKELIHLALLNKGYGFTRFAAKIGMDEKRLLELREFYQEEEKIDLFGCFTRP